MSKGNSKKSDNQKIDKGEDFEVVIASEIEDDNTMILTSAEKLSERLKSAFSAYDPSNRNYSAYLSDDTGSMRDITPKLIDQLSISPQNDLGKILDINKIVRRLINSNDIIGKVYESIETNINSEYKLYYKDFSDNEADLKKLDEVKEIIEDFNEQIKLRRYIRNAIPQTYSEGTYISYLRNKGDNYVIDYYPLGVAEISNYEINGEPCVLINIKELTDRLDKSIIKTKDGKPLFFNNVEEAIKNNYPEEVYVAYKNKEKYAKADEKRCRVIRIGNLNRKYGLTPIFRAINPILMLMTFDNADRVNAKVKSKKIIHQVMRKVDDNNTLGYEEMAYAHENLMQAWRNPTVIYTSPPSVERIEYIEPKVDNINTDTINQYRSRVLNCLGIGFLNSDGKQSVISSTISLKQLMLCINNISEQVEDNINSWYKVVLENHNIDTKFAPKIKIIDSEMLEMEMKNTLVSTLFDRLGCSFQTAYEMFGIDFEDEKQRRTEENEKGYDKIFTPRANAYTRSGSDDDNNGRPLDKNSKDPDKQLYDQNYQR